VCQVVLATPGERDQERLRRCVVGEILAKPARHVPVDLDVVPVEHLREVLRCPNGSGDDVRVEIL